MLGPFLEIASGCLPAWLSRSSTSSKIFPQGVLASSSKGPHGAGQSLACFGSAASGLMAERLGGPASLVGRLGLKFFASGDEGPS